MRSVLMYSTGLFLIQFCIQILFGIEKYKKLDLTTQEGKQRLIDGFINAIYVYDDRITFTYNYKDGTETITLSELESAKSSDIKCVGARRGREKAASVFPSATCGKAKIYRSNAKFLWTHRVFPRFFSLTSCRKHDILYKPRISGKVYTCR